MNYTTIEQSKKLLELGLSPESADLKYPLVYEDVEGEFKAQYKKYPYDIHENYADFIPCWSVGALLEVMPKAIQKYDNRDRCYKTYHPNLYQAYYHCCGYAFGPSLKQENHDMLCTFGDDTWIDVVFKTVCWLLENGYIETK